MRYFLLVASLALLLGCVGGGSVAKQPNASEVVVLKVEGLSCPHCADTLKTYLINTPGIAGVEVELENRLVKINYDPSVISEGEILNLPVFAAFGGAEVVNGSS